MFGGLMGRWRRLLKFCWSDEVCCVCGSEGSHPVKYREILALPSSNLGW